MRFLPWAAGCLAMLIAAANADAGLMTFDDVPGGSVQNNNGHFDTSYQGFDLSFTLEWFDVVDSSWPYGAHSGDFGVVNAFGGVGIITDALGADFTFDGLWAKAWDTPPESGGADFLIGVLEGYNYSVLVWSVATSLNGSYEYYGAQAGAIDELHLGFGDLFLIDDLLLNGAVAEVPEPGALTLLGLGALGLVGVARRRHTT
jgi:hypothetical protein